MFNSTKCHKILNVVMITLITTSFSYAGDNMKLNQLKTKIEQQIKNTQGSYAVAFMSLYNDDKMYLNEREQFHAASTMKTPVMIEVFKQAEENKFNLQDSIILKNEFKSIVDSSLYSMDIAEDGSESLYKYIGKNRTIYQLVYEMITVSSNLATNILIDLVDARNVMQTMKLLGALDIKVLRGVEDIKAYELGLNNTTTALDLAIIFKSLYQKKVLSETACDEMLNILFNQKHKSILPFKLPADVKIAHKSGSITGVIHDSGIIYLPDGRAYVLVLLSKDVKDEAAGRMFLQDISKQFYDYVTEN